MRPRPPPSPSPSSPPPLSPRPRPFEVLARDFLERQEAVAVGAVVDEARFEARLDAGDDRLVDVALALLLARGLDVEIDQLLAVDDRHPELLRLGGVEQHALHSVFPARVRPGWGGAKRGRAHARGVTLSSGGRRRSRPRPQRLLRADESGVGRCRCGRAASASTMARRCGLVIAVGFIVCVQAVKRQAVGGRDGSRTGGQPTAEIVAKCAAQCAASNRPQAGCGDCALPLPSLLFRGATPGRSVDLTGGRLMPRADGRLCPTARGHRLAGGALAILGCPRSPTARPQSFDRGRAKRAADHNY